MSLGKEQIELKGDSTCDTDTESTSMLFSVIEVDDECDIDDEPDPKKICIVTDNRLLADDSTPGDESPDISIQVPRISIHKNGGEYNIKRLSSKPDRDVSKTTEQSPSTLDRDISPTIEYSHSPRDQDINTTTNSSPPKPDTDVNKHMEPSLFTKHRDVSVPIEYLHKPQERDVDTIAEHIALNDSHVTNDEHKNKDRKHTCISQKDRRPKSDRYCNSGGRHKSDNFKSLRCQNINKHRNSLYDDTTDRYCSEIPSKDVAHSHKRSNKKYGESNRHTTKGYHDSSLQLDGYDNDRSYRTICRSNKDSNRRSNKYHRHAGKGSYQSDEYASNSLYQRSFKDYRQARWDEPVQRDDNQSRSHRPFRKDRHEDYPRIHRQNNSERPCSTPKSKGCIRSVSEISSKQDDAPYKRVPPKGDLREFINEQKSQRTAFDDRPHGTKRKLPSAVGVEECNPSSVTKKRIHRSLSDKEIDDNRIIDDNERWHPNDDVTNSLTVDADMLIGGSKEQGDDIDATERPYDVNDSHTGVEPESTNYEIYRSRYKHCDDFDAEDLPYDANGVFMGKEQEFPDDERDRRSRSRNRRYDLQEEDATNDGPVLPIQDQENNQNKEDMYDSRNNEIAQNHCSTNNDTINVDPHIAHFLSIQTLWEWERKEPRDIIMTLAHPGDNLHRILKDSEDHQDVFTLLLTVFAKAVSCKSMNQHLTQVLSLLNYQEFFNNAASYFTYMPPEEAHIFASAMKDMLTIMADMASKGLIPLMQLTGIHAILEGVINKLKEKAVIVDDTIMLTFKQFTRQKDKMLYKSIRDVRYLGGYLEEQEESPPEDFRDVDIFPHISEMQVHSGKDLRPNKIIGKYEDLDQYLDIQFRLLREDFVWPLRNGIIEYTHSLEENVTNRTFQDIKIYNNVRVLSPVCSADNGICYILRLDVRHLRKIRLMSSKRLIFGSLLCVSCDNFQTFMFATVVDREHLKEGFVTVRFENRNFDMQILFQSVFIMAETTAYFESYRHVLTGLQNIQPGNLPFEKYIISCENNVDVPEYLQRDQNITFDLRPLVDEDATLRRPGLLRLNFSEESAPARDVDILDFTAWPSEHLLHLDESQMRAVQTALTKEFAIIQGPPGTGKTFIGLKIVKALLHNKQYWAPWYDHRPMLIVCYTNHALDQFLEGVAKFYQEGVLRVGGRSNSVVLKNLNLTEARHRMRRMKSFSLDVFLGRKRAATEMESLNEKICYNSAAIRFAKTTVLHEVFLCPFMGKHYLILLRQVRELIASCPTTVQNNLSAILVWLGLGSELSTYGSNTSQNIRYTNAENTCIAIEEEVDFIQRQRMLPDLDEISFGFKKKVQHERNTRNRKEDRTAYIESSLKRHAVALDPDAAKARVDRTHRLRRQTIKCVHNHLERSDMMTEEEADQIVDLFRISEEDKWRLYRFWKEMCCEFYLKEVYGDTCRYEQAASRVREMRMQEDREIMHSSTVIGMTTSGAARYQAILQEVRPRIIVVEEAAEVLEAHIITSLSEACEHLILIGDHKQLRPNPTVYKLAKDFHLDVSLFERMVKNQFRCDCLELQHRMRPEIANLMHHIYKNYRNHEDVMKYDRIKGVPMNVFFINHNENETHDEDLKSHSNVHEADFVVALCNYLLQQGYKATQITVLTLYSGQMFALKERMPKSVFEGVRVAVVDNYQGEENDIILLTLVRSNSSGKIGFLKTDNRVCVALSRAKLGLYVIGNFDLLSQCSNTNLWKSLVQDMTKRNLIGEELVLQCQNHPNVNTVVKRKENFERVPDGGCDRKCDYRLTCGHVCEMHCHVLDQEHERYVCKKVCGRIICTKGHLCQQKCYEPCMQCTELVDKTIPKCGHEQKVPCNQSPEDFSCKWECKMVLDCGHACKSPCGKEHTKRCAELVEKTWPCGHTGEVKCYEKEYAECSNPCGTILECGHPCVGTCSSCFNNRLHRPCNKNCTRILVCGHECTGICNYCRPCTMLCENRCIHSKCKQRCGELCQSCMEPCEWRCEHFECSKLCSEPCDRPRCNEPCKLTLKCKHPCIGLCGEPCPTVCRECDGAEVKEILFGKEEEPDSRFILLEDCAAKCFIESRAMDQHMDNTQADMEEIQLKKCPKCSTTIRRTKRYGSLLNKTLEDIEIVKAKLLTSKVKAQGLENEVHSLIQENFDGFENEMLNRRLRHMPKPKTENALIALKSQIHILRRLKEFEAVLNKQKRNDVIVEKKHILQSTERFQRWAMADRQVMQSAEIEAANDELLRLEHNVKFCLHKERLLQCNQEPDESLKLKMVQVKQILDDRREYDAPERGIVQECLEELEQIVPLEGLNITEVERNMILEAMALPTGHWFKCPRGHVYVIGECGGAMEKAKCPECDETIGGTEHTLVEGNQLASEMDNAQYAAWSEQANMDNYGDVARF